MNGEATRRTTLLLFLSGLAISMLMVLRVGAKTDAVCLLARGWLLIERGVWAPLGNPASGGGFVPGGFTALVTGLPLRLWMDHRAPVLLILLTHLVAYAILDRIVARTLGGRARVLFAILYWLNPWRLYQSAWLDNSNYVFLTGAVHLWACMAQRDRPRFWPSLLMVAVTGLTVQLHLNAIVMVIAAVFLWLRGYWKVHWLGVACGSAITVGALVPFLLAAAQHEGLSPGGEAPPGLSLLHGWPMLKGAVYWLRYASLWASWRSMLVCDFQLALGPAAHRVLSPAMWLLGGIGTLTVVFPLAANGWSWRRFRRQSAGRAARRDSRAWLRGYSVWVFVACMASNALSPTPTMWWHNLIALHAAILPVVFWADALSHTSRQAMVRRVAAGYAVLSLLLSLGMALGSEQFQGGQGPPRAVAADGAFLMPLGLDQRGYDRYPRDNEFYRLYFRPHVDAEAPADLPGKEDDR